MATQIFVNLPVRDLPASMAFFTRLGFTFNPQFTDDTAACMVVSDTIYVMLLTEFAGRPSPRFYHAGAISAAFCINCRDL